MRAMILAAGRGKRLRPITDGCPKPLVKVMGKSLVVYHIEALKAAGVDDIVINVSHLGQQVMQTLGDGHQFGVQLRYSVEPQALETGGGIKQALPLLGTEPFILVNGDVYTDFPFENLKVPEQLAHLVLTPNPSFKTRGDFSLKDHKVQRWQEGEPSYTYTGIAVLRPELFARCQSPAFPLAPLLHQAIFDQAVSGELYRGVWSDIGTLERLQALEHSLKSFDKVKASQARSS